MQPRIKVAVQLRLKLAGWRCEYNVCRHIILFPGGLRSYSGIMGGFRPKKCISWIEVEVEEHRNACYRLTAGTFMGERSIRRQLVPDVTVICKCFRRRSVAKNILHIEIHCLEYSVKVQVRACRRKNPENNLWEDGSQPRRPKLCSATKKISSTIHL